MSCSIAYRTVPDLVITRATHAVIPLPSLTCPGFRSVSTRKFPYRQLEHLSPEQSGQEQQDEKDGNWFHRINTMRNVCVRKPADSRQ